MANHIVGTLVWLLTLSALHAPTAAKRCDARRDCYPWPNATRRLCEDIGCIWSPSNAKKCPYCYHDDSICPSSLPENERVDCHPDGIVSRESCVERACIFCVNADSGIPWCFRDPDVSQGGASCQRGIQDAARVDCHPEDGADIKTCLQRDCFWCASSEPGVPWCFIPPQNGYVMMAEPMQTTFGYEVRLVRKRHATWYGSDVSELALNVEFSKKYRLRIKICDPNNPRFEVPLPVEPIQQKAPNPVYDVQFSNEPAFHFKVRRKTGEILFDTSLGGMVFSDYLLQLSARLPSDYVYGFGENEHDHFRHSMAWQRWPMWARDQPPAHGNMYGVHPFFMGLDRQNNSYGVLLLNSNAQEVTLTPAPGIIYRTIGGILDLHFFFGPSSENVIQQYTELIGRPVMPPYWGLGFQLSRYGYGSLDTVKATIARMRQYDIPHDVQHGDIDYMDRRLDFTYDQNKYSGFPEYIEQLKREGTRFITILDPCIATGEPPSTYAPFDRGNEQNVWVKEADCSRNARGRVWPPSDVFFPDFGKPSTDEWWISECELFHDVINYDGIWIDMNEPANFATDNVRNSCPNNRYNYPPYKPGGIFGQELSDKTICMDNVHHMGRHFDVHSLYGWSQSEPTLRAAQRATGRRSLVLSRSTFPGSGKWAAHWLGDNFSNWDNLRRSITGILEFNLFGIPFVGADICGFIGNVTEELCIRWMQLGAFYSFSRNHNGKGYTEQDPGMWPEVARIGRMALHVRYLLLPYLYTLFHDVHVHGGTVLRSIVHEFPMESRSPDVDEQFMWGSALIISPVLREGARSVEAYFPSARWFSWYTGDEIKQREVTLTLDAPLDHIPLHMRGGCILVTQEPANCTMWSRRQPMGLVIAYSDEYKANGSLFWDDGESMDTYENGDYFLGKYSANQNGLRGTIAHDGYEEMAALYFNQVRAHGVSDHGRPCSLTVSVNEEEQSEVFTYLYDDNVKTLLISNLHIAVRSSFDITWTHCEHEL